MRRAPALSTFIRENAERILSEWETFARSLPIGATMDVPALRDHAKAMLEVIASDLERPQTQRQQDAKARGAADTNQRTSPTAASEHGSGRAQSQFTVNQMVAEFRALRATVTRLWGEHERPKGRADLDEMIRFNEAIDQAIAESLARYTHDVDETKERFLAILGHDLRTPLGAILMSTQFILDTGGLSESHHELITRIATSSRRMNQMVADLLDFSRTQVGGAIPISRTQMDAGAMLHAVAAEVVASYPSSKLEVDVSGDLRGAWDCDRLTQAVTNLVGNAAQHGSNESPIRITACGEADEVVITVRNDGPVIPGELVGRIFKAMKGGRGDTSERRHLGLGLYIVDRIVAAHGGKVEVQSSETDGTAFTVRLPRHASS